ncbi:substrate-binding periplasmic protein [Thalassotalea ganghwensis]
MLASFRSLLVLVCFFCVDWVSAHPQEEAVIKLPTAISIAAPSIPPLIFINDNGELKGTLVKQLQRFSQSTGIDINIDIMTWTRALEQVKYGAHDALIPAIKTPEREHYIAYPSHPITQFQRSVLVRRKTDKEQLIELGNYLKGKTLAKARSMLLGNELDELIADKNVETVEVNSIESALQMLNSGRVDLVATDENIARTIIEQLRLNHALDIISVSDKSAQSYLAFSKQFAQRFDINQLMILVLAAE